MESTVANPHLFWKEVEKRTVGDNTPPQERRHARAKLNSNVEKITTAPHLTPIIKVTSPVLGTNASVNVAFDFWRKVASVSKQDDKEVVMDSKTKSRPYNKYHNTIEESTYKVRALDFITDTKNLPMYDTKRIVEKVEISGNEKDIGAATSQSHYDKVNIVGDEPTTSDQLCLHDNGSGSEDKEFDISVKVSTSIVVSSHSSVMHKTLTEEHQDKGMKEMNEMKQKGVAEVAEVPEEAKEVEEVEEVEEDEEEEEEGVKKVGEIDDMEEIEGTKEMEGIEDREMEEIDGLTADVGAIPSGNKVNFHSSGVTPMQDSSVDTGDSAPKEGTKYERHTPEPLTDGILEEIEPKKKRAGKLKLNLSIFKHKRAPSDRRDDVNIMNRHSPRDVDRSMAFGTKGPIFGVELNDLTFHNELAGVPTFVISAIEALARSEFGDVDYLFSDSHVDPKIFALQQQIDQGLDISQIHEVRLVAGLLKLFFLNLPTPLLGNLYKFLADIQDIDDNLLYLSMLQSILWSLPILHMTLLQFFVKFLREKYVLATQVDSMEYVMNKLGAAFGPAFMRNAEGKQSIMQNEVCRSIINHYEVLFLQRDYPIIDMKLVVRSGMLILEMASTERILDRILDSNYNEPDFVRMFLSTHTMVLSTQALLESFVALYVGSNSQRSESIRKWKLARNQRILDVIRLWMDTPTWEHVREDRQLVSKLCKEIPPIEQWLVKGAHKPSPKSTLFTHFGMVTTPRSKSAAYSAHSNPNFSLLDTTAVEIAHHCTQIDHDLFLSIRSSEWIKFSEGPQSALDIKLVPHISAFQKQSIQWKLWVGEILKEGHLGRRVLLLGHFILIAQICCDMGNYNCAYSIIDGLAHPSVRRLETTWQLLPKASLEQFNHLVALHHADASKNIADMFRLLKQMKPPCVPYFGTLEALFLAMDESNPIHPREYPHLIDLDRLRTVYGIVEIFARYDKNYSVKIVPRTYIHLQEMIVLTPEQLVSYSLKCEEPIVQASSPPQHKDTVKQYKTPTTTNHWTTEVQRIWSKPFEQLPIGIDLPRLAALISVGSYPTSGFCQYDIPPPEPAVTTTVAGNSDGQDTRARDIFEALVNLTRFIESEDYATDLQQQFCKYVILDGAKDRDMSREIAHLFEYLGKNCRTAQVLKAINQAIIAPPIIELTLNVCTKLPFRDAGGWRIFVHRHTTTNQVVITHVKKQKARSQAKEDEFEFEWCLEMVLDGSELDTMAHVNMAVTRIGYGELLTVAKKSEVSRMLSPYTTQ